MAKAELAFVILLFFLLNEVTNGAKYYGKYIGELKDTIHDVSAKVYAANQNSFYIVGFNYDGLAPDAHFWAGTSETPGPDGFLIPDEMGSNEPLMRSTNKNFVITLPQDRKIKDVKWLSIWCKRFQALLGYVAIPVGFEAPKEKPLDPLPTFAHGVRSAPIVIKDAKTLYVPSLYYDGAAPDAFFLVGTGRYVHHDGATKLANEDGKMDRIKRGFNGENIKLTLPGEMTVFDIDWFSIYCIRYEENFGHITFPEDLNVPAVLPNLNKRFKQGKKKLRYYGSFVGDLEQTIHQVKGSVFVAGSRHIFIQKFNYDGLGPEVYFTIGTTPRPSRHGYRIANELGSNQELGKYDSQDILLTLPKMWTLKRVRWLSIWSKRIGGSFGHIIFPDNIECPQEYDLGPFEGFYHDVRASSIVIKDAKTIQIKDLHYDGLGLDAYFLVGNGSEPNSNGITVPDESGSTKLIHEYTGHDITLLLPGDLTVFDINWFSIYCISCDQDFGHMVIPRDLNVPPDMQYMKLTNIMYDNCEEVLHNQLQVYWKIVGDTIFFQYKGKAESNNYLAFGISPNNAKSKMVGADVAVAYFDDKTGRGKVVDYILLSKSQCSDGSGSCPDTKVGGSDDFQLISSERENGILTIAFTRKINTGDSRDLPIRTTIPIAIVAATGPLNSYFETSFHAKHYTKQTTKIHFGRKPTDNCAPYSSRPSIHKKKDYVGWPPLKVDSEVNVFRAQIGPTGGERGYPAITGRQSWGIAWWINGLLIPELTVYRGTTYTFIVEGGNNASNHAAYHPLYITNNPEGGGYQRKEVLFTKNHEVYSGVEILPNDSMVVTAAGRLCEWRHKTVDKWEESKTFLEYKLTLEKICEEGVPAHFEWTPDETTPDLVYYQCLIHRDLGWKIHVKNAAKEEHTNPSDGALFNNAEPPNADYDRD